MEKPGASPPPPAPPTNVYTPEFFGSTYSDYKIPEAEPTYDFPPRDSVTSETGILTLSKDKGQDSRQLSIRVAIIAAIILLVLVIAVVLGVMLTKDDHPCAACTCETSILIGQVTDVNNVPMTDATITYADQPNTTLATTDITGKFQISGVCATPQTLSVTKPMFAIEQQKTTCSKADNCTSYFEVQIKRLELPFITKHPVSKLRLTGQSVSFCCGAEGVLPPTKYEWFKDDVIINEKDVHGDKLTLKRLTEEDSGYYACRVHNAAGPIFSDSAKLTVTATPIDCSPEPTSRIVQLPEDCVQPETNKSEYDVGMCASTKCNGKIKDQTLCLDPESESYCCQAQETETVSLNCQGYTLPVLKVTSCGCTQCATKASQINGRVVSTADVTEGLDSVIVYYNNKNVTSTDSTGHFRFSTLDAVSRVPLTFRDETYSRVLDTTVIFQVSSGSIRYDVIKMMPLSSNIKTIDSAVDNILPILDGHPDGALVEITIAANSVYNSDGEIYNGAVQVSVYNVDMRNLTQADLVPGDFTTVDEHGNHVILNPFGVFSLRFTDPSGQLLFIAGLSRVRIINQGLDYGCDDDEDNDNNICNIKLWVLNSKTGLWEMASSLALSELEDLRRRKRDGPVIVGSLELTEFEWYSIGDIGTRERCWAKVIAYGDENFNPASSLPNTYQVTSVLEEQRRRDQDTKHEPFKIFRLSSPSSVTTHGSVGVCVPLVCTKDLTTIAFLSATSNNIYLKPLDPTKTGSYYSLTREDQDRLTYYISDHRNPEIYTRPLGNSVGPIYPGGDAGDEEGTCSQAGTNEKHFQFYCETCEDIVCNTFHSIASSPSFRTYQTFYPETFTSQVTSKQSYCFIGVRITTDSSAVRVVASSSSTRGRFYGRREIVARKGIHDEQVDACMEFKCSGDVYNEKEITFDNTQVVLEVKEEDDKVCSVRKEASDFTVDGQFQNPLRFDDPETYGRKTGVHKVEKLYFEPVCVNDRYSPQNTMTENCQINGDFIHAIEFNCS